MRVRISNSTRLFAGEIVDLPDVEARAMVAVGDAEKVSAKDEAALRKEQKADAAQVKADTYQQPAPKKPKKSKKKAEKKADKKLSKPRIEQATAAPGEVRRDSGNA